MSVGNEGVEYQQRYVGICISFIKHLCGPDIYLWVYMPPHNQCSWVESKYKTSFFSFSDWKRCNPKPKCWGNCWIAGRISSTMTKWVWLNWRSKRKIELRVKDSFSFFCCQAILIEGVESLLINIDLKKTAQKALEQASENLKRDPYSQRSHSILFVKNKLLAMCSR